jgi:ZIP family zinc transporter/zinc and cadmium transporter
MIAGMFYAAIAALGDLAGGVVVLRSPLSRTRRGLAVLTGFGAGFMLAVALVGMLQEALELKGGLTAVLAGYLIVHLTQHALTPHFHFGEETHGEAMTSRRIGVWVPIGLLPHSFFDGVAISSGFLASQELGLLIFGAILLHKVPEGVSLASVMLASGNNRWRAFNAVGTMGLATVAGGVLTPWIPPLASWGLPLAAGVAIRAASNLIPESQHEHSTPVQGAVFAGVLVYYLLALVLPH